MNLTWAPFLKFNSDGELQVNAKDNLETFNANFSGAESDTTILTPSAGKKLEIHSIYVSTNDKLTDVQIDLLTSSMIVFKLYTTNTQTGASADMHIEGAINEVLSLTCGAGTFVSVVYHEE